MLLLVIAAVLAVTGTPPGRALLARTASTPATNSSGGVEISGISGVLAGTTRVDRIALSDSEGVYASISDAEIDWRRTALFSLTFEASRISAGRVEILRTPVASGEDSEGSAGLPIQLDLREIDLPQVHLGEKLVGTAQDLRVQAHLSARRDIAAVSGGFKIMPEGRQSNIAGDFEFDAETNAARLDAVLEEPPGGLLATAFDLPGKPAVNITAKVEGSLDAARFSLRGNAGGENAIDISGTGGLRGEKFNVSASGNGTPSLIVPEKFRELLAGRLTLDVDMVGSTEGQLDVKTARIDARNFYAVIRGRLDTQGTSDLSGGLVAKNDGVDIRGAVNEGLAALSVKSVAFSVKGPSGKAEIALSAEVPKAGTSEAMLSGIRAVASSPAMDLSQRIGEFIVRFEADRAKFENPDLQRMFPARTYGEASGKIDGGQAVVESLSITNEALKFTGDAVADLEGGSANGNLGLAIGSRFLPATINRVPGEDLAASAKFEAMPGGGFRVSDATVTKGADKASGRAEIADGEIDASLNAAFNSLKDLTQDFDGALKIDATLSGPVTAPNTSVNITADRIDANGHEVRDLKATVSGVADMAKPDLDFELSGAIDDLPLTGSARFIAKKEGRVLEDLKLVNGNNRISGNIVLQESGLAQGELSVQLPEIAPLAALGGQDVQGGISGNILFSGSNEAPLISVNLSSNRISRADLAAEGIAADISIRDYLASPGVEGTIKLDGVRQGATSIDSLRAKFALDGEWTSFDVNGRSDGSPVAASGRVKSANGTTSIELAKVSASYRGIAAALASPTTVQVRDGEAKVDGATLSVGGGTAAINGSIGNTINATVQLSSIDAAIANRFAGDLGAQGRVSGKIDVSGPASDPQVRFAMKMDGASLAASRSEGLGAFSLSSEGTFKSQTVNLTMRAAGGGGLDFSGSGSVGLGSRQSLDFRVRGALPYSVLAARLARQGLALEGTANADITVSGTPSAPVINGSISSSGGRFIHAESGIAIKDLALAARFDGKQAIIEKLTGNLSTGGTLQAGGNVGMSGGFPADLSLKVRDGRYTDRNTVDARFNANITLTGPLIADPVVGGTINMQKAVITVPDRLPDSISRLDVQHVNASSQVEQQADNLRADEPSGNNKGGLRLALALNAPNQIFVRGRGIDAELGGNMRLQGPVANPSAVGGFEMRRGRLSILGKRLDFTSGTVSFSGSLVPRLNMAAQTSSDGTTITITVSGLATSPQFSFSSVPALSEDEVLAKLIFNKNMSNLSPLQIAQLAQAAATLAGKGGNSSLLDKFQHALQVDDLDIRTDSETGETTVGAGRYINDRTYIGVERGQSAGTGKVRIDLNIGKGVKVRGEATESGKNKAGIFYEREY